MCIVSSFRDIWPKSCRIREDQSSLSYADQVGIQRLPADACVSICTSLKRLLVHHRKKECCRLCKQAGTAGLDGLDLSRTPRSSGETGGQLAAVEELAGRGLDRAEGLSGLAANEAAILAG